ncbi:MAG TPA: hypothetical protein VHD84_00660 [Candidatus Saccharimonadales bacterium]|nr:hypothetical protein [Candidatus Saccharimonadales bacterium]
MSSAKIPPKPSKDVIYVDVDDEITGIIDKVENSEHKVVALVLPKRAASLQSIVNMKLLKRSADSTSKNVVLITSEAALLPLAGAAGLHVAKNLQSAPEIPSGPSGSAPAKAVAKEEAVEATELDSDGNGEEELPDKIDYSRPVGALAAKHEADNPETIDLDDEDEAEAKPEPKAAKAPKDKRVKVPNFDRFRMMLGLGGAAIIALIIFIILALFILPKATITIQTTSEPVSASFNLDISPHSKLDPDNGTLPSKLESTDQTSTQQVTATGQQNNGDKASGSVTLTAQKCSGNLFVPPPDLPAGTGVSTSGLTYITQSNTSFHGVSTSGGCATYASNGAVNIVSQSAGSKYNVSNANFTVPGRSDVTGSGSTSGGTDNVVTVLSQSDVDNVKQKLEDSSDTAQFTKDFENKLAGQGEYVLTSTLKAGSANITTSPDVGQPASTANVTIKITYTVLTVQKSDLSQIIQKKLASQIDKTKQELNGNFLNDADITVQSQSGSSSASLSVNEDTTAVPIIDVATVKKQSEGKKVGQIQSLIGGWAGVKSVNVELSPFWVSKVPHKDGKINVVLQEIKSNSNNGSGQ